MIIYPHEKKGVYYEALKQNMEEGYIEFVKKGVNPKNGKREPMYILTKKGYRACGGLPTDLGNMLI